MVKVKYLNLSQEKKIQLEYLLKKMTWQKYIHFTEKLIVRTKLITSKLVSVSFAKLFGIYAKHAALMINIANGKRFNTRDKDLKNVMKIDSLYKYFSDQREKIISLYKIKLKKKKNIKSLCCKILQNHALLYSTCSFIMIHDNARC